jgi:hypothetical protein
MQPLKYTLITDLDEKLTKHWYKKKLKNIYREGKYTPSSYKEEENTSITDIEGKHMSITDKQGKHTSSTNKTTLCTDTEGEQT